MAEPHPHQLSIGALSRATGVPVETLRTWERRYGVPSSERTPTGHRRYSMATIDRIRLVTEVLGLGHRPSTALSADVETLREIIAQAAAGSPSAQQATDREQSAADAAAPLEAWFEHVERYEGRAFDRELRGAWSALGARDFLQTRVGPFLTELGERWSRGALGVRHEHFASERLREFLAAQWRPLSDSATGPTYVLATLPGERHVLGLHLVALTVALSSGRIVFLGADSPPAEIAAAAAHHAAQAVLLSAADGCDRSQMAEDLATLRGLLPAETALRVGGRGFHGFTEPDPPFETLQELDDWVQEFGRR